jgi:hypothetical protein
MNCGDWVESCTALVEDEAGLFCIIAWADEMNAARMPTRPVASVTRIRA